MRAPRSRLFIYARCQLSARFVRGRGRPQERTYIVLATPPRSRSSSSRQSVLCVTAERATGIGEKREPRSFSSTTIAFSRPEVRVAYVVRGHTSRRRRAPLRRLRATFTAFPISLRSYLFLSSLRSVRQSQCVSPAARALTGGSERRLVGRVFTLFAHAPRTLSNTSHVLGKYYTFLCYPR